MSQETHYKHCTMRRPASNGTLVEIAWIPEKFAEVGRKIILGKKTPGAPIWEVSQVSDLRLPESYLLDHERDYKTQRQASDI